MITHLEPDILECEEVKRPFGNITKNKVGGGDRIPAELFNIVKDDVVKVMQSICQQIWKLSSGHRTGKEKMERYTQLNVEFQRITWRDKKAVLNEQCKETEENNRMGKTSDLFKKIGDIKGTLHARMGTIKDRDSNDLREAEKMKKRWQEYTELYKTDLNNQGKHNGVVTHLGWIS